MKRNKPVNRNKVNKEEEGSIDTHLKVKILLLSTENAGNMVVEDTKERHALGGIEEELLFSKFYKFIVFSTFLEVYKFTNL